MNNGTIQHNDYILTQRYAETKNQIQFNYFVKKKNARINLKKRQNIP